MSHVLVEGLVTTAVRYSEYAGSYMIGKMAAHARKPYEYPRVM